MGCFFALELLPYPVPFCLKQFDIWIGLNIICFYDKNKLKKHYFDFNI